jgi:type III secretion protein C
VIPKRLVWRLLAGLLAFLAAGADLVSAQIPWNRQGFSYAAEDKPLTELLRQLCAAQSIPVVISDKVEGTVNGKFIAVEPQALLESLAAAYGLIWFFDGDVLYIYDDSEIDSQIINAPGLDFDQLDRILRDLQIDFGQPRNSLRMTEELVSVAGPPRFVKLVAEVISGLLSSDTAIPDAIEVYPLKYAWAYDTKFESNGTQLKVPGVATVLQQLLPSYASGALGMAESSLQPTLPTTVAKLTNTSLPNPYPATSPAPEPKVRPALPAKPTVPGGTSVPAESAGVSEFDPLITYDVRLNAVVVRDTKARLRSYGDVIAALDKPVRIIQIQASIIDINVDYSLKYGNQFLFTGRAGSFRASASLLEPAADGQQSSITDATANLIDSAGDVIQSGGLNFSSIVLSNAVDFINRIQLLEQDGLANILSQPTVVTLNNLEAVIQRQQTFYVKVPGTYTTDLYDISAGTVMKVTPHVIEDGNQFAINMIVNIQDGEIEPETGRQIENLPLTTEDSLNTRAVLRENNSLLIGGLVREERTTDESGVPTIRKIPVIGFFFKQRARTLVRMKRLFLITPKLITRSYSPTEDVTPLFDELQSQAEREAVGSAVDLNPPNIPGVGAKLPAKPVIRKALPVYRK